MKNRQLDSFFSLIRHSQKHSTQGSESALVELKTPTVILQSKDQLVKAVRIKIQPESVTLLGDENCEAGTVAYKSSRCHRVTKTAMLAEIQEMISLHYL